MLSLSPNRRALVLFDLSAPVIAAQTERAKRQVPAADAAGACAADAAADAAGACGGEGVQDKGVRSLLPVLVPNKNTDT